MPQTLFLRDFTVLDFAFLDEAAGGFRGESVFVSVELTGNLDDQGFILDFGPAKKVLKKLVDETLDHKLAVPARHPLLKGTADGFTFGAFLYDSPSESVALLEEEKFSLDACARYLAEKAKEVLPENVGEVRFFLREESRFEAEANFRYTHGLRLHEGNCQRLIHGHRNPVEVWLDGKRAESWEKVLAEEWQDAHFTFAPTLLNQAELDLVLGKRRHGHPGTAEVAYESPQGRFHARIPASRVILLPAEPSIENIARLGFEFLRAKGVAGDLKVVAFEGLNKGSAFSG